MLDATSEMCVRTLLSGWMSGATTETCAQALLSGEMSDATTETCAQAMLSGGISQFDLPTTIASDRGRQFLSGLWRALLDRLHIEPRQTTHKSTAWLNVYTANTRPHSKLN